MLADWLYNGLAGEKMELEIKSTDWIFVTGKAGVGKTYLINALIPEIKRKIYIFDYNQTDYIQHVRRAEIWQNQTGRVSEFEQFLKLVYGKGNCFVILEEADTYLRNPSPFVTQFVNTARNRGIGAIVTGKRAKSIPPIFRTRFNHLLLFRSTLPDDIEYLEDWAGTGKGSLELLRNLKTGEFIGINLDKQRISGRLTL